MESNDMKLPALVCVYGTLRRGHGNYKYLLSDQEFLGEFKTEPKYTMFSFGGFPGVLLEGNTSITCEIFRVTDLETLYGLDRLEGYPTFYNRLQIDTPYGKAWMYYIEEKRSNNPLVDSGDWNEYIGINNKIKTSN